MNRTQLINFLLRRINAKRYLEIGFIDKDENYEHINCQYKAGVSNKAGFTFKGNSSKYFDDNNEKFDLIFIDGYHTEKQVLKDIENAFAGLAPGGIIVLHDCMPPDEWHQRSPEDVSGDENWNGTVWKAVLRVFNRSVYKCSLLDTDWGCGIIDTSALQLPLCLDLPDQLDYKLHYESLLKYKTSVLTYLCDNVKVFYHIACMGNWKQVCKEQLLQLMQNGFQWIDITMLGTDKDLQFIKACLYDLDLKATIIFHHSELTLFEKPACLAIQEYARHYEGYILYLHTKGVSNPTDETKAIWRNLMMHELVYNSRHCITQLPHYDLIGVNWRDMPPVSHFCGNFWYASTQYLKRLPDFTRYYDNSRYKIWDQINSKRLGCEFWIGSYRENPKILSLAYRNVDFCNPEFWKNKFIPVNGKEVYDDAALLK